MKLDWITIIAIIIMVVGGVMVYQEGKVCRDPMKTIMESVLGKNLTDAHVELLVYNSEGDIIKSYEYYEETGWEVINLRMDKPLLNNFTSNN